MYDRNLIKTVSEISRVQAHIRPDAPAIWFEGRVTTFADLDRRANACANALLAAGLKPGDRIACLSKNCDEFFIYWFGAMKARICLAPINWRLAPPEIEFILNDLGAKILVCGPEFADIAPSLRAKCPSLVKIVGFEAGAGLLPSFSEWINAFSGVGPEFDVCGTDDIIQLYTSGTTGLPKGVPLNRENYAAFFDAAIEAWAEFSANGANLVAMPLFHVAGANTSIVALLQGCRIVVMRDLTPHGLLKVLEEQKITYAFLVPAVINALLQEKHVRKADFSHLKSIFYGASPIAEDVLLNAQACFGASFTQLYGMTESTGAGTYLAPGDHHLHRQKLRSCGKPMPGVAVRVMADSGAEAQPFEVGEIQISSRCVTQGYWNNEEASAEAIRDGWLHTGDAGYFDEEGFLFIHDRVKDMIVSGGENVYPAEVENALFSHPDVADAAVIGVPDGKWGEAVKAIVVLRPGAELDAAMLIAHCRSRIAGYKCPKTVDVLLTLPRNPSGKVLRRELRKPYWEGKQRQIG